LNRVVIADDHSFFRSGLESVLAGSGFDVVASVGDGASAISAIDELTPDFAILDVRMPELDGVETLEALRKEANACPVILLAAEYEDASLVGAIQSGANALVSKTNAHQTLLEAISAVQSGGQFLEEGLLERYIKLTTNAGSQPMGGNGELSKREAMIAEAAARGLRNREIAREADLSEAMVKLYLHRIYTRLGLSNRTELALYMQRKVRGETN
jgi:two-component system, NarL family, nitrate/nitrite response regulator NarL